MLTFASDDGCSYGLMTVNGVEDVQVGLLLFPDMGSSLYSEVHNNYTNALFIT